MYTILIMEECVLLKLLKDQHRFYQLFGSYARINEYGFIEAPYRKIDKTRS